MDMILLCYHLGQLNKQNQEKSTHHGNDALKFIINVDTFI